MKPMWIAGIALLGLTGLAGACLCIVGCSLRQPTPGGGIAKNNLEAPAADAVPSEMAASAPEFTLGARRVGGDLEASIAFTNGRYRSGECQITTPLPEGYPDPTPPGAIDVKRYPLVRRAEIGGTMEPDWGMNFAFFPLFNHIKRREIAMTSPVEMNYEGLRAEGSEKPSSWTMSFVYRTSELGAAGVDPKDERILVEDIPPMTVVSIGLQGPYKLALVNNGLAELRRWLAGQSEWQAEGEPRALFYNGPEAPAQMKWSEIQIPVGRRSLPAGESGIAPQH